MWASVVISMVPATAAAAGAAAVAGTWRVCDVTAQEFGAAGDGLALDTSAIRQALRACDTVVLPRGRVFLSG
jgi:polygalacturonase